MVRTRLNNTCDIACRRKSWIKRFLRPCPTGENILYMTCQTQVGVDGKCQGQIIYEHVWYELRYV